MKIPACIVGSLLVHMGIVAGFYASRDSARASSPEFVAVSCAVVEDLAELAVPEIEPAAYEAAAEPVEVVGAYRTERPPTFSPEKPFRPEAPTPPRRLRFDPRERIGPSREATVTPAVATNNPPPEYPAAARRRGIEGRAVIEVTVAADGVPTAVRISESSGHRELDEAAAEAVWKWRFVPARRGGRPVESTQTIPFRFQILD